MKKLLRKRMFFIVTFFILFLCKNAITSQINPLEEGIRQFRAENFEEALENLKQAKAQNPESSLTAFFLGLTYRQLGEVRAAIEEFKRAIDLKPPVLDAYFELIDLLLALDELKEAKEWVLRAEKEGVRPAQLSFLKGLILIREGKTREAIQALENAKKLDPTLEQAANLQIALAQIRERKFKTALQTLKAVISIDPKTDLADFAKEYERALERLIKEHRTFRGGLAWSYQFDDNAVGADGTIIKRKSDNISIASFRLEAQPLVEPPWYINFQSQLSASYYKRFDTLNTKSVSFLGVPGYNFRNGLLTLPTSYTRNWLDEKEYSENYSLRPTFNWILRERALAQFFTGFGKTTMLRKYAWQPKEESRTSVNYHFGAGYIYTFAEGRGLINLRYEYQINEAEGRNWKNRGNKFSGTLLLPIWKKMGLSLFGDYFSQRFEHLHTVFEKRRRDTQITAGFLLRWKLLNSLSVNLQYLHLRNKSNIKVYKYDRNPFSIGIEYEF